MFLLYEAKFDENQMSLVYCAISLGWSGSGLVIEDHLDHGTSKKPMNSPVNRIDSPPLFRWTLNESQNEH